MELLVTGASGHLGANLVREALADGHRVRALVRATSDRRALQGLDIAVHEGDILDARSLERAMAGVEVVLHAAAVYRNWAADEATILGPAVEGTQNVIRAAKASGVRRIVHTSSNATVGYPPSRTPWDESHHMEGAKSVYIRAKCEAERVALALGAELGIEVVVVNPCGILGPWDVRLTPTTKAVKDIAGGAPSVLDVSLTHAADIARGHLLAATKGVVGERYLLSGDNVTREDSAALMTELCGAKRRAMLPPRFLMRLVAWNEVRKARNTGEDAGITGDLVADVYGCSLFYDSSKARTQLGWTSRPGREVLLDTLAWLGVRGQLPAAVAAHVGTLRKPDPTWPTA